ncbi:YveK family protein [Cohnella sp.]|uniref:YveK family protein n=1 Tax=Cohnella sp. TaxID=1883426 RepID=UPI003564019B
MGLREMLSVVWRRAWLIAIVVVISCISSGLASYYLMNPTYEASTKLIVNKSSEVEGIGNIAWDDLTVNIQLIATYKELILTKAIMNVVVQENPDIGLTSEELVSKVNVSSVNDTQVMTVSVMDSSYERAALIVNAVSHVFQAKVIEIMKVDNVTILNEASVTVEPSPISPNPVMNVIISFIVSTIFILCVIFLMAHLDDTVKSEHEIIQAIDVPILTIIHQVNKKDLSKHRASRSARKASEKTYVATN